MLELFNDTDGLAEELKDFFFDVSMMVLTGSLRPSKVEGVPGTLRFAYRFGSRSFIHEITHSDGVTGTRLRTLSRTLITVCDTPVWWMATESWAAAERRKDLKEYLRRIGLERCRERRFHGENGTEHDESEIERLGLAYEDACMGDFLKFDGTKRIIRMERIPHGTATGSTGDPLLFSQQYHGGMWL